MIEVDARELTCKSMENHSLKGPNQIVAVINLLLYLLVAEPHSVHCRIGRIVLRPS